MDDIFNTFDISEDAELDNLSAKPESGPSQQFIQDRQADLKYALTRLANLRREKETLASLYAIAYENFKKEHADLIQSLEACKQALDLAERDVRQLGLQCYSLTNNKQPVEGVQVKRFITLDYDEKEALNWGIEHRLALTLDKRKFEEMAKINQPDFVIIRQEPRVTISKDLES